MSDAQKIDEALEEFVSADGIDAEEAHSRRLAVEALRRIAGTIGGEA